MSQDYFIKTVSAATTGALGSLPRSMVFATREVITGYTPDVNSGLITITAAMVADFKVANPTAYGTNQFLDTAFAGSVQDARVYILSTGGSGVALSSAMLDKANYSPRSWSFLCVGSQTNGFSDEVTFLEDCVTASDWCTAAKHKIFFHAFSMADGGTLPAALLLGGDLTTNARTISIITNAFTTLDASTDVYHNPLQAALCWSLYGGSPARSIGSLSDCHDLPGVDGDTYSAATRAYIASQSLMQYNGAKDQGGSLFCYDTYMNDDVNPPLTPMIETVIAQDYIEDYVTVFCRNALQAAGQTGLNASMKGVGKLYSLVNSALQTLWSVGAIETNAAGNAADYTLIMLTKTQIDALDPAWQTSGVIPVGSIVGNIRAFAAAHYATIKFNFN
jgi:hypothetical protein